MSIEARIHRLKFLQRYGSTGKEGMYVEARDDDIRAVLDELDKHREALEQIACAKETEDWITAAGEDMVSIVVEIAEKALRSK